MRDVEESPVFPVADDVSCKGIPFQHKESMCQHFPFNTDLTDLNFFQLQIVADQEKSGRIKVVKNAL
jgi:hypothetical protein